MNLWVQFAVLGAVILFAARGLVSSSGRIAKKRGWADMWAGFMLLSFATTLPELFTSVSAAAVFKSPDLSVSNLLGSVIFNLLMIAVIDVVQGPGPLMRKVDGGLILLAGLCVGLSAVAGLGVLAGGLAPWRISPFSVVLLAGYLLGSRLVYAAGCGSPAKEAEDARARPEKLWWAQYAACALIVLLASPFLVRAVDGIAEATGWGRTFAGTLLLAAATSLPEVTTTITAARRGFYDMALGNILGANALNLGILFFSDAAYAAGSIFAAASAAHALTALLGILMTGAVIIGIIYRSKKSLGFLGWDAVVIICAYFAGSYILYSMR